MPVTASSAAATGRAGARWRGRSRSRSRRGSRRAARRGARRARRPRRPCRRRRPRPAARAPSAAARSSSSVSQPNTVTSAPRAVIAAHERLGIQPSARGPVGDQRDAHRHQPRLAGDVRPHRPRRRRRRGSRRRDRPPRGHVRHAASCTARRSPSRASRRCCSTSARTTSSCSRPLAADTPVGRFLAKRGPGLHHVAYQVADIDAALARLRAQGVRLIDETAAHRHPRLARRVPAPVGERLGAHRDRRTSYGARMTARRAAIGFQGGQVLSLRISEDNLTELRAGAGAGRRRRLARGRGRRRRGRAGPRAGRLPARRVRRAPRRLLASPSVPSLRVRVNALDLALYRRVRSVARTPDTVRWVRSYSRLGEHGAVWLAAGAAGIALDGRRRGRWARATGCVGAAYLISTSIKLAVGRRRPAVEDLPHLMATPTGLSFPSSHATSSVRRGAGVRPAAAAARPLRRRRGDGPVAALPRRPLPVRRRRRRGARHRPREPRPMKVGIVGMPNAGKSSLFNALTRAGAEAANYPFTTIEPNVAVVPVRDAAARGGGADGRRVEPRARHDRLPRHRRPRRGRAQGRGPGQPVPREHPRDRRAAARRPLPPRRERDPSRGPGRPGRATWRRSRPSSSSPTSRQAERRHARVVREARGGDRAAIAEEAWLPR